jgi:hypothetical protein
MPFVEMLAVLKANNEKTELPSLGVRKGRETFCIKKVANCGDLKEITTSAVTATGSGILYRVFAGATTTGLTITADGGTPFTIDLTTTPNLELGIQYKTSLILQAVGGTCNIVHDGNAFA